MIGKIMMAQTCICIVKDPTKNDGSRFFVLSVRKASASHVGSEKGTKKRRIESDLRSLQVDEKTGRATRERDPASLCFRNRVTWTKKIMFVGNFAPGCDVRPSDALTAYHPKVSARNAQDTSRTTVTDHFPVKE